MKKGVVFKALLLFFCVLFIAVCVACSPSETDIQTAIASTEEAKPTIAQTAKPTATYTPTPTDTPLPTDTPIPLSCSEQSASFIDNVSDILARWDDAEDLASSTARISLAGPISDLQSINREANQIESPACAQNIHEALTTFMDTYVDAYLSFSGDDDAATELYLIIAQAQEEYFHDSLLAIEGNIQTNEKIMYIVAGDAYAGKISYSAEIGRDLGGRPELPWTLVFDEIPDNDLFVSLESRGRNGCAIMHGATVLDVNVDWDSVSCEYYFEK